MGTNEDDFVEHLVSMSSHDTLLFFTNKGKVYKTKGYNIPEFGRTAKGLPVVNLLELEKGELINAMIPVEGLTEGSYLFFATKQGIVKRSRLEEYANIRTNGLIALQLREGDELISVRLTDGTKEIAVATKNGMLIRFPETEVRPMGRSATGVKGIELDDDDEVIGMDIIDDDCDVLVISEYGYGKRTSADQYRVQKRGGKGLKTCNIQERNGSLVAMKTVTEDDDLMIITDTGVLIRIPVSDISQFGRIAMGVKLIRLDEGSKVTSVAVVEKEDDE